MSSYSLSVAMCFAVVLSSAGCGDKPLSGKREDVQGFAAAERARSPDPQPRILVPAPRANDDWTQGLDSAQNTPPHVAANLSWTRRFTKSLGQGRTKSKPLQVQPVLSEGRVFVMNTSGRLSAIDSQTGRTLWRKRLPVRQSFGGGLAVGRGKIVVVGGDGYVGALDAEDGTTLWERVLPLVLRSAPSLGEGQVVITSADQRSLALSLEDGAILWEHETSEPVGVQLTLAAKPSIASDYVLLGYENGTLYALERLRGRVLWQTPLVARRRGEVLSDVVDISAPLVIDQGRVFASGFSGKTAALSLATGAILWQTPLTTLGWIALYAETLYVVDSFAVFSALEAKNGLVLWDRQLKAYRDKKQRKPIVWNGPVMVGGTLIVSGSQGKILVVAPENGRIVKTLTIEEEGFYTAPIAGEGLVYLLGKSGTLYAFQ